MRFHFRQKAVKALGLNIEIFKGCVPGKVETLFMPLLGMAEAI